MAPLFPRIIIEKKTQLHLQYGVEVMVFPNIKHCINGNNKKYVLEWPILPNTWIVKIGTNFSRQEVLVLEDTFFQLQKHEILLPWHRFVTIAMFSIP